MAINSIDIIPRSTVTADQSLSWAGRVYFENNGEATVRLDSVSVRLFAGADDVTDEYLISYPGFNPGVDTLAGMSPDSIFILFSDNPAPDNHMTIGTVIVEMAIYGTDINSGEKLIATTESGGKGAFVVQTPAELVINGVLPSVERATVSQEKDWIVDVALENRGDSEVELYFDSLLTWIEFSTSDDFVLVRPHELLSGRKIIEGNSRDTLRFVVDKTGSIAGACTISATISSKELNSQRGVETKSSDNGVYGYVQICIFTMISGFICCITSELEDGVLGDVAC